MGYELVAELGVDGFGVEFREYIAETVGQAHAVNGLIVAATDGDGGGLEDGVLGRGGVRAGLDGAGHVGCSRG